MATEEVHTIFVPPKNSLDPKYRGAKHFRGKGTQTLNPHNFGTPAQIPYLKHGSAMEMPIFC